MHVDQRCLKLAGALIEDFETFSPNIFSNSRRCRERSLSNMITSARVSSTKARSSSTFPLNVRYCNWVDLSFGLSPTTSKPAVSANLSNSANESSNLTRTDSRKAQHQPGMLFLEVVQLFQVFYLPFITLASLTSG